MEKLTTLTGVGVPLRRSNVDTDQIIPAVFLKRVTKSGFDDACSTHGAATRTSCSTSRSTPARARFW